MTTGLLVMAYGTASGPEDIERYYTDIRGGRPPSPELLRELTERYAAIGNRFPLTEITEAQAEGLGRELDLPAYVGMKHSPPFIPETVEKMAGEGIERILGLVMAPHYSRMSVGGYVDRVRSARSGIDADVIESWHAHPAYLDVLTERVRWARDRLTMAGRRRDLVVFTAHSLPARIVDEGDPYPDQLRETADAVAERLGLDRYTTGWQSAGRTPEPWLGPPLEELIVEVAADHTAVVVVPCGFVADHLEILYDLDVEAREVAERAGLEFARTESLNAEPDFIRALASIARDRLASWDAA